MAIEIEGDGFSKTKAYSADTSGRSLRVGRSLSIPIASCLKIESGQKSQIVYFTVVLRTKTKSHPISL